MSGLLKVILWALVLPLLFILTQGSPHVTLCTDLSPAISLKLKDTTNLLAVAGGYAILEILSMVEVANSNLAVWEL